MEYLPIVPNMLFGAIGLTRTIVSILDVRIMDESINMKCVALLRSAFLFVFFTTLFSGCKDSSEQSVPDILIEYDAKQTTKDFSGIVQSVEYVVLQTEGQQIIGGIDKIIVEDNLIYVGDYKAQKISVFNREGYQLRVLAKQGRGPGEYLGIQSFSVNNNSLYVMDVAMDKILEYDSFSLEYVRSFPLPVPAWDFTTLTNGGFMLAYAPMEGNGVRDNDCMYRIIVTDSEMKMVKKYFAYKEGEADVMSIRYYLSSDDDSIVYGSIRDGGFCLFSRTDGNIKSKYTIDYGDNLPLERNVEITEISKGRYSFQTRVPYLCKGYACFNVSVAGEGQTLIMDIDHVRFYSNNPSGMKNTMIGIIGRSSDCFIGNWQSSIVYDALVKNGFDRAPAALEALIMEGAPFLVFYHMNNSV